jgi:hypothetical protein
MSKYILPAIMISLNLGQSLVMAMRKDLISTLYWLFAAGLNLTVALKQ